MDQLTDLPAARGVWRAGGWRYGRWRRPVAIVALLAGLGAALWSVQRHRGEARVVLLLTHVGYTLPGSPATALGRERLVGVRIAPALPAPPWRLALDWSRGAAPEASHALELQLPSDPAVLQVECHYDGGASEPWRGTAQVTVGAEDRLQVVDIGRCDR